MYFFILMLLFSINLSASEIRPLQDCVSEKLNLLFETNLSVLDRSKLSKICQNLPAIENQKELEDVLTYFLNKASAQNHLNRHIATEQLNKCEPTASSKVLVIAFEGTGAYEPLMPVVINMFNNCFAGRISSKFKPNINYTLTNLYHKKFGLPPKWSALQAGIQSNLVNLPRAKFVDWYSFPSEETELLAGTYKSIGASLKEIYSDIVRSIALNPKGIQNARKCIKKYFKIAQANHIEPKVIILSHSSGARSLIKFAEHIKKELSTDIHLAYTIDPVQEAHEAIKEVLPQKITEPLRLLTWQASSKKDDYPYSKVKSQMKPQSLYKPSNVKNLINYYQKKDRLGINIGGDLARFGIHGSPILNGENILLEPVGDDAHGAIGTEKQVLERFNLELIELLD